MPAGSEGPGGPQARPARPAPVPLPELPHTWRPFGPRIAMIAAGIALVVVCTATWLTFDEATQARFTIFQKITLAAIAVLAFTLMYALVRSRVVAERGRLVVVNGYKRREYEWAQVVGVHLPPGAPWVTLDLADGNTVSAMGIQGSDGERSRVAALQLRRLASELAG